VRLRIPPRSSRRPGIGRRDSAAGRLRPLPFALALAVATGWSVSAQAQSAADGGLQLRPSLDLRQHLPPDAVPLEPVFLIADRLTGQNNVFADASGNVELRKHSVVIKADRLRYYAVENEAVANGDVRVLRDGNLFSGPALRMQLDTYRGDMPDASYFFNRTQGHGHADHIEFLGRDHVQAEDATYTTCTASPVDWFMQATHLDLNFARNEGVARDARVVFKGATILPLPYATFPLTDARKSGWLPPTLGVDSRNGVDLAVPYYWNIAPNYDATLTPRIILRRGFMGSGQFRWLQPTFAGQSQIDLLPSDASQNGQSRWAGYLQQNGGLGYGLTYAVNYQRVSDNNWWQDFGGVNPVIASNRTLPQQGSLTWAVPLGNVQLSVNRWQTLQNAAAPIGVPYNQQPQLSTHLQSANYTGLTWQFDSALTRFTNATAISGDRLYLDPQVSLPFVRPGGYITPKLALNLTRYVTDTAMANGSTTADRALPTFSLDSGLTFERNTHLFGRDLTQTLEPRLYYVYTPYRNQQYLPNFDSADLDLNLATIYTDNVFSGTDRIADANNLTGGVTTRLLDPRDGTELGRLTLAQRVLFSPQRVTLTGTPIPAGLNDTFALASVNLDPQWSASAGVQYNLHTRQLAQTAFSAHWKPAPFKTISASYQYQTASSGQIPLRYVNTAWQWQISPRWYSVGQANYSILDKRFNNGLLGFEYDGGCWVGRVVLQRSSLTSATSYTRILFQLELVGFSRLGNNPLSALKQNIPGYQILKQFTEPPSRFANYE
jgi:LPS-assembly protein